MLSISLLVTWPVVTSTPAKEYDLNTTRLYALTHLMISPFGDRRVLLAASSEAACFYSLQFLDLGSMIGLKICVMVDLIGMHLSGVKWVLLGPAALGTPRRTWLCTKGIQNTLFYIETKLFNFIGKLMYYAQSFIDRVI